MSGDVRIRARLGATTRERGMAHFDQRFGAAEALSIKEAVVR